MSNTLTTNILGAVARWMSKEGVNTDVLETEIDSILSQHESRWTRDRDACTSVVIEKEGEPAVVVTEVPNGLDKPAKKIIAVRTIEYYTVDPEFDQPDQHIAGYVEVRPLTTDERDRLEASRNKGLIPLEEMKEDFR